MRSRNISVAALALTLAISLGGLTAEYREASRFRQYYAALHQEAPELNAWQRVLVTLAMTTPQ